MAPIQGATTIAAHRDIILACPKLANQLLIQERHMGLTTRTRYLYQPWINLGPGARQFPRLNCNILTQSEASTQKAQVSPGNTKAFVLYHMYFWNLAGHVGFEVAQTLNKESSSWLYSIRCLEYTLTLVSGRFSHACRALCGWLPSLK